MHKEFFFFFLCVWLQQSSIMSHSYLMLSATTKKNPAGLFSKNHITVEIFPCAAAVCRRVKKNKKTEAVIPQLGGSSGSCGSVLQHQRCGGVALLAAERRQTCGFHSSECAISATYKHACMDTHTHRERMKMSRAGLPLCTHTRL